MVKPNPVPVFRFQVFSEYPVLAAFSTRKGGVSKGPLRSLNLGLHVGDDQALVLENRRRFCTALGVDSGKLVCAEQVHGNRVAVVGRPEMGLGALDQSTALPAADALVTAQPGVPLAAFFADCVPLYFYDPNRHATGLAHAGWRGTVAGVGPATVRVMQQRFGTIPAQVRAAIGPSIGPCCYRVGTEVAEQFARLLGSGCGVISEGTDGSPVVDLWQANRLLLVEAGLKPEHIETAGVCTACNDKEYFSYRASNGRTGRLAALIMLE